MTMDTDIPVCHKCDFFEQLLSCSFVTQLLVQLSCDKSANATWHVAQLFNQKVNEYYMATGYTTEIIRYKATNSMAVW